MCTFSAFNVCVSQHSFFNLFFFYSMTHNTTTSFNENFRMPTVTQHEGGLGTGTKRHSNHVFLKTVLDNQHGHWQKVSTRAHRMYTRGTETSQKDAQAPRNQSAPWRPDPRRLLTSLLVNNRDNEAAGDCLHDAEATQPPTF